MTENETPTLQTERLILRDLREGDWRDAHEYASAPETVKYMPFGPNTKDETKAFINKTIDRRKESPRLFYDFAMVTKTDSKLIGSCSINITDLENKEAMIGYILNRKYWNQGYTTEAARKVAAFGFEQLGLHPYHCQLRPRQYRFLPCDGKYRYAAGRIPAGRKTVQRSLAGFPIVFYSGKGMERPERETGGKT